MVASPRAPAFVALSLVMTWWLAALLPHYRPMIQASIRARLDEALQQIPSIKVDWGASPTANPRDAYNGSKVALLIEGRPLPHLVPQMLHMMSVVPPDWRFLFIGSPESAVAVGRASAVRHQQVIGRLDLMVLPEPWAIDSREDVFRLLADARFYDEFLPGVEWILKYEADSILCANSGISLNDWLDWDWVGAPRSPDDPFSGNGGLSLRRVSAAKRVLAFQARFNDSEPEDEWFGKRVYVLPGAKVAAGQAQALAVEDVYVERAMGYHVREGGRNGAPMADAVWRDPAQRAAILQYCPELSLIMDMKLQRERCSGDDREGTIHSAEETRRHNELEQLRRKKQEEFERKKKQMAAEAMKKKEEAADGKDVGKS